MLPNPTWLVAALILLCVPWQNPAHAQSTAGAARVVVPEGQDRGAEAAPRVLRGSAIKPKPAPKRTSRLATAEIIAGDTFWSFDRARGRLVACEREYGVMVGQTFIRCTQGHLPRRLRPN